MISSNKYYDIEAEINGPYILHKELEKAIMERAEAWAGATKVTTTLTFEPKCFGGASDKIGKSACKLEEIDSKIADIVERITKSLSFVRGVIAEMPKGQQRTLVIDRYTKYMNWQEIADDINVSQRNIWEIRKKALIQVDEIMKNYK